MVILFFIWADTGAYEKTEAGRMLCGRGKRGEGRARNALGSGVTTALSVLLPNVLFAELPLSIDDLVTHKSKAKINASVVYSNSDRSGLITRGLFPLGTKKVNQDVTKVTPQEP